MGSLQYELVFNTLLPKAALEKLDQSSLKGRTLSVRADKTAQQQDTANTSPHCPPGMTMRLMVCTAGACDTGAQKKDSIADVSKAAQTIYFPGGLRSEI